MKVLLDENLPHLLRTHLTRHEVSTVTYRGWNGMPDDKLLAAAEDAGIEVLLTGDKNLSYQQNLDGRSIAVVVLSSPDWPVLKERLALISAALGSAQPGMSLSLELSAAVNLGSISL